MEQRFVILEGVTTSKEIEPFDSVGLLQKVQRMDATVWKQEFLELGQTCQSIDVDESLAVKGEPFQFLESLNRSDIGGRDLFLLLHPRHCGGLLLLVQPDELPELLFTHAAEDHLLFSLAHGENVALDERAFWSTFATFELQNEGFSSPAMLLDREGAWRVLG